ncbi:Guanine deaminase [Paraliobacillus sp. PM-2]|uniref:nucleoside deaminase n=1 Tax=Paraliobacillus sp. PM-2 TaxID=1462524 RepID=UPI00061CA4C1|nr:nucleoside deaminase [Paraliobacillus sp. PM-2]CQR46378.1 Guanine deaminase [Paraliobacillus sp. PM-2]
MEKHQNYLKQTIALAIANVEKNGGEPFASIIVDENGIIVGTGKNDMLTKHDPTAHAEVQAIRDACENLETTTLEGCTMYTSCEPCPMCFGAIYWSRLKKVYYAADHALAAAEGFDDTFIFHDMNKPHEQRNIPFYAFDIEEKNIPFEKWKELT